MGDNEEKNQWMMRDQRAEGRALLMRLRDAGFEGSDEKLALRWGDL